MPAVERCCAHKTHKGREVAAAALAPLIPESSIPAYVATLLHNFPTNSNSSSSNGGRNGATAASAPIGNNRLHGYILQVEQLVRSFVSGPCFRGGIRELVGALLPHFR